MMEKDAAIEGEWTAEEMAAMEKEHGETMMTSGYMDYRKEIYDKVVAEGKIVVLDFAANWCPVCQKEEPELCAGAEQLTDKAVVFKVHYKDDDTTEEHTMLAKQYGIAYQHTKVVIKNGKMVAKSPEAWDAQKLVAEVEGQL